MIAPKNRISKQRRNKRRSSHWKLTAPGLVVCPNCGEATVSHRMCKACGHYKGKEIVEMKDK